MLYLVGLWAWVTQPEATQILVCICQQQAILLSQHLTHSHHHNHWQRRRRRGRFKWLSRGWDCVTNWAGEAADAAVQRWCRPKHPKKRHALRHNRHRPARFRAAKVLAGNQGVPRRDPTLAFAAQEEGKRQDGAPPLLTQTQSPYSLTVVHCAVSLTIPRTLCLRQLRFGQAE